VSERLTQLPGGVSRFAWHPSGRRIAFFAKEEAVTDKQTALTITQLRYQEDGKGLRSTRPSKLYLLDLKKRDTRLLIEPPAEPTDLIFHPKGGKLLIIAPTSKEAEDAWLSQIWVVSLASGKAKTLLPEALRPTDLAINARGSKLVFRAPSEPQNSASPTGLWLLDTSGGTPRLLTGDQETSQVVGGDSRYGDYPVRPSWSEDGKSIMILISHRGRSHLATVNPHGHLTPLTRGDRVVTSFSTGARQVVFTAETADRPGELFLRKEDGEEVSLSQTNLHLASRYHLSPISSARQVKASDGQALEYWLMSPRKARKEQPLVLEVHGGPHASYGHGFYLEFQLLASAGYTVVFTNPRGSAGFGADFQTAVLANYGTVDASDLLLVIDHARSHHDNPKAPIHLTGGSYGGFMTNWLISHSDLFASAVSQRGISNWLSFYGSSDIGYHFTEREIGGSPWLANDDLWRQSPLKYVQDITTPLLILHAEEDYRCPIEQAQQLFAAIRRIGKTEVQFIRFPEEGHELSRSGRPDRRIARLDAILAWFEEHRRAAHR